MNTLKAIFAFAILVGILFPGILFAQYPVSNGYVTDGAGILSAEAVSVLSQQLNQFEKDTGHEIAVVTVPDLAGDYIEHYAVKLFEVWGIGKKGSDNGVLLLVAKSEKQVRIEVGYGLEGALTDAQSKQIINEIITPAFKQGDFDTGVRHGVEAIIASVQGELMHGGVSSVSSRNQTLLSMFFAYVEPIVFIFILLFSYLASIFARSKSWWAGGVVGGVFGLLIALYGGFFYVGIIATGILVPFGLLFDFIVSRSYNSSVSRGVTPPWWSGGSGWRSSSGGSSFGGFGGGSSGGGGASGSW